MVSFLKVRETTLRTLGKMLTKVFCYSARKSIKKKDGRTIQTKERAAKNGKKAVTGKETQDTLMVKNTVGCLRVPVEGQKVQMAHFAPILWMK